MENQQNMTYEEKVAYFNKINQSFHRLGRITMGVGIIVLLAVPFMIWLLFDAPINWAGFWRGFANVAIIYYPVAVVEFLTFTPMLGVGGTYLSFLTGNLTNLKIPCVMNSRDIAGVEQGTPENEIISTISVASSALTTTLVIFAGVLLLVPLTPILQSPVLLPAFNNVVAALFGALGLKYFVKQPLIAALPIALLTLLCIFVPSMINQTSILIIPAGLIALLMGYLLNKKGLLR